LGKPYETELALLGDTYAWSHSFDLDRFVSAVAATADKSLVAIGSGGSLSAAHLVALLHRRLASRNARAATPLDVRQDDDVLRETAYLLLSAGGGNGDILDVFRHLVVREPDALSAIVGRPDSKLADRSGNHQYVDLLECDFPAGRDGFLATNSLLAFSVLITRAWLEVFAPRTRLPSTITRLPALRSLGRRWERKLDVLCQPLWERSNLIVIHSTSLLPAAWDLESKFTEAALGNLQFGDFRHFAHGRHHWLAKRGDDAAVLILVADEDQELARRTSALIPEDVPCVTLNIDGNLAEVSIAGIVLAMHIAGSAGRARGIDPGRPGVPGFGRKLYNLRPGRAAAADVAQPAISMLRKHRAGAQCGDSNSLQPALDGFLSRLRKQRFRAVVFDYDGTLCGRFEKTTGPSDAIRSGICSLLDAGIQIGIATGRGGSVRRDLQAFVPADRWSQVLLGYYNGSVVVSLEEKHDPAHEQACPELREIERCIRRDPQLKSCVTKIDTRGRQISLQAKPSTPPPVLRAIAEDIVRGAAVPGVRVLWSTHSVDILASGVSKLAVLEALSANHGWGDDEPVLTVGDLGCAPGNDFELLAEPYSLSVAQVSPDSASGWNVAPAGYLGPQAAVVYLNAMIAKDGRFRIDVNRLKRKPRP